jgi:hypothetical protein
VHRCRNLDPRDTTTYQGIPITTPARTLVDLAQVLTAHQLANAIHEAAFRNRFDEQATREAMARAHGKALVTLHAALQAHADGSAGTRSGLEDRFLESWTGPQPRVNTKSTASRSTSTGRTKASPSRSTAPDTRARARATKTSSGMPR